MILMNMPKCSSVKAKKCVICSEPQCGFLAPAVCPTESMQYSDQKMNCAADRCAELSECA